MKKIFMVASLVAGLTLITSCSVKIPENEKNSDCNNTIYRGRTTYNFKVLYDKLNEVIEIQERIIEQNEELPENEKNSDYNNTICRGRTTHNFKVLYDKLEVIKNQEQIIERIIEQNEEMLEILRKQ